MEIDYFELIMKIILVIVAIITAYMITLRLIGRSPDLNDVSFGLITLILSSMMIFVYKFAKFQGKVEEFIVTTKNSFGTIKEDTNSINNNLTMVNNKLNNIGKFNKNDKFG